MEDRAILVGIRTDRRKKSGNVVEKRNEFSEEFVVHG